MKPPRFHNNLEVSLSLTSLPLTYASPVVALRRPGFYERLILSALTRMQRGCLRLTLPDGSDMVLGTPGAAITAFVNIRNAVFFKRCVLFGDIGFGEAYVEGDWDTKDITQVIAWFILNLEASPTLSGSTQKAAINVLGALNRLKHLVRPNSLDTSRLNIAEHYDLGNDFYHLWLDRSMTYSSASFSDSFQSLEEAQVAKYDALCQKLQLNSQHHVLEIGCGWGGFASHAVKNYGCRITAVTISERQFEFALERFTREGIADRIDLQLRDYRMIEGQFDRIVSIEMMEALGDRYLETYCAKLHELLRPAGLIGLQYITVPDSRHRALARGVDWIQKHIFPGSLLLSIGRVNEALNRTGDFFLHDLSDLGPSYARTLSLWRERFNARLDEVKSLGFDDRFIRKWNYYLSYCEAAFAMRNISVVQAIYTRPNNHGH